MRNGVMVFDLRGEICLSIIVRSSLTQENSCTMKAYD